MLKNLPLKKSCSTKTKKWSASTENDDVFELQKTKSEDSVKTAPPQTKEPFIEPKELPNHRYTYSEYMALRNEMADYKTMVAITPLMQNNQNLQSQHFRMSQSIKAK